MYPLNENLQKTFSSQFVYSELDFLSLEEIDNILNLDVTLRKSKLGNYNVPSGATSIFYEKNEDPYRNSLNTFLHYGQNGENRKIIDELYLKIFKKIIDVNIKIYNFDLKFIEPLQFTKYKKDHFYKIHTDLGNINFGFERKLSFSIQLSDPNTYTGGLLKFHIDKNPLVAENKIGSITFFASFMPHEVTPVTEGERYSLVGWIVGPKFT